jgi:hypothetical protein
MTKKAVRWSCRVETLRFRRSTPVVRTVFAVEQQSFILAEGDGSNPEEVQHCEFMRDMFMKALGRIGVPIPSLPAATGGKVISLVARKKRVSARTKSIEPTTCDHGTMGCSGRGEKHWCGT